MQQHHQCVHGWFSYLCEQGLAALLVQGLSNSTPEEILTLTPDFFEMLGLKQSLMPSRNNGFLNMFKLMQRKTLELVAGEMKQVCVLRCFQLQAPCPGFLPFTGIGLSSADLCQ